MCVNFNFGNPNVFLVWAPAKICWIIYPQWNKSGNINIYVAGKNFAPSVNAAKAMQQASKQASEWYFAVVRLIDFSLREAHSVDVILSYFL